MRCRKSGSFKRKTANVSLQEIAVADQITPITAINTRFGPSKKGDAAAWIYNVENTGSPSDVVASESVVWEPFDDIQSVYVKAGTIVHDSNNFLQIAMSALELITLRIGQAPGQDLIGLAAMAQLALSKAGHLNSRLLNASPPTEPQIELVDINAALDRIAGLIQLVLGPHITLSLNLTGDDTTVACDRSALENAVVNLALNSRNAINKRGTIGIETLVSYSASAPSHRMRHISLSFSDDGPGMSAGTAAHAFKPFYTEHRRDGGVGLGLTSVMGFVDSAGGKLSVTSDIGHGATFRLLLPAAFAARDL